MADLGKGPETAIHLPTPTAEQAPKLRDATDLLAIAKNLASIATQILHASGNPIHTSNTEPQTAVAAKPKKKPGALSRSKRRQRNKLRTRAALNDTNQPPPTQETCPEPQLTNDAQPPQPTTSPRPPDATAKTTDLATNNSQHTAPSLPDAALDGNPSPMTNSSLALLGDTLNSSNNSLADNMPPPPYPTLGHHDPERPTDNAWPTDTPPDEYAPADNAASPDNAFSSHPLPTLHLPSIPSPSAPTPRRSASAYSNLPYATRQQLEDRKITPERIDQIAHGDFTYAEAHRNRIINIASQHTVGSFTIPEIIHILGSPHNNRAPARHNAHPQHIITPLPPPRQPSPPLVTAEWFTTTIAQHSPSPTLQPPFLSPILASQNPPPGHVDPSTASSPALLLLELPPQYTPTGPPPTHFTLSPSPPRRGLPTSPHIEQPPPKAKTRIIWKTYPSTHPGTETPTLPSHPT